MKKFITYVSRQTKQGQGGLSKGLYVSVNNRLNTGFEMRYPITALINAYVKPKEKIKIIAVYGEDVESYEENYKLLKEDVKKCQEKIGFICEYADLKTSKEELVDYHLDTYLRLVELIDDGDEVYACTTYGTKPFIIVEFMALDFIYKARKNVMIPCIIYGKFVRDDDNVIYDITPLFRMSQISNMLANQKINNPEKIMRDLLSISED